MIFNIFQLNELPFLKVQTQKWKHFKEKQKFMPLIRSITYQGQHLMSKIFTFYFEKKKINKKLGIDLVLITQKQILPLKNLYQIMNQKMPHEEFNKQMSQIKSFQKQCYLFFDQIMMKYLLKFNKKQYLHFGIYKNQKDYYIKVAFQNYDYELNMTQSSIINEVPKQYKITHPQVKIQLQKQFQIYMNKIQLLPLNNQINKKYQQFYDNAMFYYDQIVLKLQVFHNYPLLRLKMYLPIKFKDARSEEPLHGAIYSNADPDCMYGHFIGYNADSIKQIEDSNCETCQIYIQQLQENQLLQNLRDNVFNPRKDNILYCPEYNRFKLLVNRQVIQEQEPRTVQSIEYLNYYHLRCNVYRSTNKNRMTFYPQKQKQIFSYTFLLKKKQITVLDPARGRYCQHYQFTDLRLFYLSYDKNQNMYKCPICQLLMFDFDIIYLKQVAVLFKYINYKLQNCLNLLPLAKIIIDHNQAKVFIKYQMKQKDKNEVVNNVDQIPDYYATLVDPYVPFPQYTLHIVDRERQKRMNDYMFSGLREQQQNEMAEQDDQEDDQQ